MARKAIFDRFGNIIKSGLQKVYKAKTAPLQVANTVARTIAPNSKIAGAIAAAASPGILKPSSVTKEPAKKEPAKKEPAKKEPAKKPQPPRKQKEQGINKQKSIKGSSSNKRGTFTSRKRTGEGNQGTFDGVMPMMGTPGQDISKIARRPNRVKRMKAGGLAIKGQGKAFLNSKR